jgi:hypothetical protein
MKKKLIAFLIIGFLLAGQYYSFAKPYEPQVKGGFKSCTTTEYRYKAGKIVNKSGEINETRNFDDKGNMVEVISYEQNKMSNKYKMTLKYDSRNLPIEEISFDENVKPKFKVTYAYDEKSNKIGDTSLLVSKGEVWQRGSYKYDKNNFLIEETHEVRIDSNQYSKGTTYFKNDDKGNKIIESAVRSAEISAEVNSEQNLSDKDGRSKDDVKVQSKGEYSAVTYKYNYDSKGNIIKIIRISTDGYKFVKEFKYDQFGNVTEEFYPPADDDKEKYSLRRVFVYKK